MGMMKPMVKKKKEPEKWWKKPPRSSRICLRCEHKYSSHIDVRCLKIIQRKPERIECDCKGFVANEAELKMIHRSLHIPQTAYLIILVLL